MDCRSKSLTPWERRCLTLRVCKTWSGDCAIESRVKGDRLLHKSDRPNPLEKGNRRIERNFSHFNILNSQAVRAMYLRCAEGLGDLHSIRSLSNRREVCLHHSISEEVPFVIR